MRRKPAATAVASSAASADPLIDAFVSALWVEDGLAANTLAAYRRDLSLFAQWLRAAGGTTLGAARLVFGLCKQRRALIGPVWQQPFWTDELKAQLAHKLGLKKFPDVRVSPAAPMPMVIGILRPTIVLPENAPATWQQPQWEAVLLHEAAHSARRDPWAALAQHIAVLLFWWCPLVHMMARRLNDLMF